eukprot:3958739-Pleurochrysis_carterae.AAC.1
MWPDLIRSAEQAAADPSGTLPASSASSALKQHRQEARDEAGGSVVDANEEEAEDMEVEENGEEEQEVEGECEGEESEEEDENEAGNEEESPLVSRKRARSEGSAAETSAPAPQRPRRDRRACNMVLGSDASIIGIFLLGTMPRKRKFWTDSNWIASRAT